MKTALRILASGLALSLLATGYVSASEPSMQPAAEKQPVHSDQAKPGHYTCPMHPQVNSDKPGTCPICHMTLIKVASAAQGLAQGKHGRKIKFYRSPMNPANHSDIPAKDEMGMDYIPVYEDEAAPSGAKLEVPGRADVSLSTDQEALSGTRSILVKDLALKPVVQAPGRVVSGNQVSFQIYEQDLALIRPGQSFTTTASALPGEVIAGRITSIDSILDPMTRTARINGLLSGPKGIRLRAENSLLGRIEVNLGRVPAIPEDAVMHTGTRDIVYVTDGHGTYHPQPVRLGAKVQGFYIVKEGLSVGTLISAGPNFLLDSESRIRASYNDTP